MATLKLLVLLAVFGAFVPQTLWSYELKHLENVLKSDPIKHNGVKCNIAIEYGQVNKSFANIDRYMTKIYYGSVLADLNKLKEPSYEEVKALMSHHPLLEHDKKMDIHKYRSWRTFNWGTGSISDTFAVWVKSRITSFIGISSILDNLHHFNDVNMKTLLRMIGGGSVSVNSFTAIFHRSINKDMDFIDVSVVRFPDIAEPYFRVYKVKFHGFNHLSRTIWQTIKRAGVSIDFDTAVYQVHLERPIAQQAIDEASNALMVLLNTT